jgi:hypothetical protein
MDKRFGCPPCTEDEIGGAARFSSALARIWLKMLSRRHREGADLVVELTSSNLRNAVENGGGRLVQLLIAA